MNAQGVIDNKAGKENAAVDILKLIATFLIVGSHALPLWSNRTLNYYYGQWFFRFCVPFFFISTGYYFSFMREAKKKKFISRLFKLYILSSILYLPLFFSSLGALDSNSKRIGTFVVSLITGYGHLWYLIAATVGLFICYWLQKHISNKMLIIIASFCFIIGFFFDEYYHFCNINAINQIGSLFSKYNLSRSGLFFAFPMFVVGMIISKIDHKTITNKVRLIAVLFVALSFLESSFFFSIIGHDVTLDLGLFNWEFAACIFIIALSTSFNVKKEISYTLRKISTYVYIVHQYFLVIMFSLGITGWFRMLLSFLLSVAVSIIYQKVTDYIRVRRGNL